MMKVLIKAGVNVNQVAGRTTTALVAMASDGNVEGVKLLIEAGADVQCKGGEAAGMNFDKAGPLTEVVLLGNIALRVDKKLLWDATTMRFPNAPEADQYLHHEYRPGWEL